MRLGRHAVALIAASVAGCAGVVPKAEMDRCTLGIADGNDAYATRQGAACGLVARRLAADDQPRAALGYARKACELQDASGCAQYLAIVRAQPALGADELQRARTAGDKACSGLVIASDGADARPLLCERAADLYADVAPASAPDARRLYTRACHLGDDAACARAQALGAPTDVAAGPAVPRRNATTPPQPLPDAGPRVASGVTTAPAAPACHEMRACVALDVRQRNMTEVVATMVNRCDRAVTCTWCPVRHGTVDRTGCKTATLSVGASRADRDGGLWYDGFDAIAYDCADVGDDKGCLGI